MVVPVIYWDFFMKVYEVMTRKYLKFLHDGLLDKILKMESLRNVNGPSYKN